MAEFHVATFVPSTRADVLAGLAQTIGLADAKFIRADTRKPFLQEANRKRRGLAITHVRRSAQPFSMMATSLWPNIGVDAELWPAGQGDGVFLKSIMAPEEEEFACALLAKGYDAALFLWVAKEAALKATGMVMVDPRDVAISHNGGNRLSATKSKNSDAVISPAVLEVYRFSAPNSSEPVLAAFSAAKQPRLHRSITVHAGKLPDFCPLNLDSL